MSLIFIEILFILALIMLNGLMAMSEIAVVSARKVRLEGKAEVGEKGAQAALDLANSPGPFLSTVQIGITLVGILAGAVGGASFTRPLNEALQRVGLAEMYSHLLSGVLVVMLITYFSLVLGELAPKRIALINPEKTAARVAPAMKILSRLVAPVVWILNASTSLVLRITGVRQNTEPSVTEEEVKQLIDEGTEIGVFEPIEDRIVDQVFRLGDQRVISLAIPRSEIVWLDVRDLQADNLEKVRNSEFTHFPVVENDLDHVLGYVKSVDIFNQCLEGKPIDLTSILNAPLFVPEKMPVYKVLDRFREKETEIAFVLDEYGGVDSLVTLRDILEALVGGFSDNRQHDAVFTEREDGSWLIDGMASVQDFRDLFDLEPLPGEEQGNFYTLGGFVLSYLGIIPKEGDHFTWKGLRIEVVDMDGRRVDKVLIIPGITE
jgi:putative hemolysin